jgi:hypothetical protein
LESDAFPLHLAFDVLVPVQAQLGVVRKIGAELQKEWAEVLIDTIEIVVVHQCRSLHDPGIGSLGLGVVSFLGAIHRTLLLRLADEHYSVGDGTFAAHLSSHVFLALSLKERQDGNPIFLGEPLDVGHEGAGHRLHRVGRSDLCFLLVADVAHGSLGDLQARHDGVEIHAIDTFHFQRHVLLQHIGGRAW